MSKTWTQRDGTKIPICEMEDEHIINALKMLERMAEEARFTITPPVFQGEMAQFYADRDYDRLMSANSAELASEMYPAYDDLMEELEERSHGNRKNNTR